ncbi:MAG: hypothetical protein A3G32_02975 [Deltaproteobacteria bacterium RIFCSPLOWO2_12_FULL_40_28]|nr:MAG: hypothetical protein A3C45_01660 [Deltaproteobacteria bacterium RIFCSPHIGHO2_02_FULL_40_28]OGQ19522.1 MAG: hypothetical protein A3E27_02200 [Deltaproteobacteria bacterium RIFCSPHIGHO2_12_FULL_40_32]OGQ39996.1 MAG: hypothetical protein A3I69_08165 [Deltaproteobacteria bacterium RIFCSPLOWO2_02_FULL_40_36]OGQ54331.1 MAG: hypothetical protein A3G32_02975 [Deltaproteobacteria bacterium RIFCSPLOWO2_12_FULL_40_28]
MWDDKKFYFMNLKSNFGFTLIEAVLSLGLVAVGVVGIMFAYQNSAIQSAEADQQIVASYIGRSFLERIIAARDVDGYTTTLASINSGTYDESPVTGFAAYTVDTTATEVNPDDDNSTDDFQDAEVGSGYARVTVAMSWNGGANSIQLETLIAAH